MNALFDLYHQSHVHFFKHAIWELKETGQENLITARDKEVTTLFSFADGSEGVAKSMELANDPESADRWERRRARIIEKTVNMTVDNIEVYLNAGGVS